MSTSRTRIRRAALTGIAALAATGALTAPAHAASTTLSYSCKALGGGVAAGSWTIALTMDLPETVVTGSTMKAPKVTARVTTSTGAADLMRGVLNADKVAGTATLAYRIDSVPFDASATVPETQVPASGPIVVDANGVGEDATAPDAPTTSTVRAGAFTADLTVTKKDGSTQAVDVACTLPDGADATVGTVKVVQAGPTSSTSSSSGTATSTTSAAPTSGSPTSSGAPSGPPVDTGQVSEGANGETVALGLLAVGGVVAAGWASRRRLDG